MAVCNSFGEVDEHIETFMPTSSRRVPDSGRFALPSPKCRRRQFRRSVSEHIIVPVAGGRCVIERRRRTEISTDERSSPPSLWSPEQSDSADVHHIRRVLLSSSSVSPAWRTSRCLTITRPAQSMSLSRAYQGTLPRVFELKQCIDRVSVVMCCVWYIQGCITVIGFACNL